MPIRDETMTTANCVQGSPNPPPRAPIRTFADLSVPWGVAFTDSGTGKEQILVTETGADCVTSLTVEGEKTSLFGGEQGSAVVQFSGPRGIAVDTNDNILIVDGGNHRLQKFNRNVEFVASVGTMGSGLNQFMYPTGIAISKRRMIYVCDRDNGRIQILNADLTFSGSFGQRGDAAGQFSAPLGLTLDSRSNVYIADSGNHCIQVYTEDGRYLRKFGSRGSGQGKLYYPSAVCMESEDTLHVVDGNGRVCVFSCEGQFLQTFGELRYACGIAVDRRGQVYVSDSGNNRLQVFGVR